MIRRKCLSSPYSAEEAVQHMLQHINNVEYINVVLGYVNEEGASSVKSMTYYNLVDDPVFAIGNLLRSEFENNELFSSLTRIRSVVVNIVDDPSSMLCYKRSSCDIYNLEHYDGWVTCHAEYSGDNCDYLALFTAEAAINDLDGSELVALVQDMGF